MTEERLIEMLLEARNRSGLPLDFWGQLTLGLPHRAIAILCSRWALFPRYMNSQVRE